MGLLMLILPTLMATVIIAEIILVIVCIMFAEIFKDDDF